ncbi:hypothetical protein LOC67_24695 [Stieleria sp. JC731]|nr:hypothetical protein [Stieleria sp. JC731]
MNNAPNPYRRPAADSAAMRDGNDLRIQNWLRFRYHFVPPILLATVATGDHLAVLSSAFVFLPMMALATELGPWIHPLNLIFSIFVLVAVPALEIAKRIVFAHERSLRISQVLLWWLYWGTMAVAMAGGTYRGP